MLIFDPYCTKLHAYFFEAEMVFVDIVLDTIALGLSSVTDLLNPLPVYVFTVCLLQVEPTLQVLAQGRENDK